MNYFRLNKKLLFVIVAIAVSLAFVIPWFRRAQIYDNSLARDSYVISALISTSLIVGVVLFATALWRAVSFMRGNRHQGKHLFLIVAITLVAAGILLSIAAYTSPITVEVSVNPCSDSIIPECYGQITNPILWPSIGIAIAGFIFTSLIILSRRLKRSANSK